MAASATPATQLLSGAGVAFRVHSYRHDLRAGFGAQAAQALTGELGVVAEQVLKTLIITVDGAPATAVLPVGDQLALKAAAVALGGRRAAMAEPALVRRVTGYVLGGVCPLGQRTQLPTVVHIDALEHASVLCSAGRRGLEIELAPADLVRLSGAVLAHITRRR